MREVEFAFSVYKTAGEYITAHGQKPPFNPALPVKRWRDPDAGRSPRRFVSYDVIGRVDGKPAIVPLDLTRDEAAEVNIPPDDLAQTGAAAHLASVTVPIVPLGRDEYLSDRPGFPGWGTPVILKRGEQVPTPQAADFFSVADRRTLLDIHAIVTDKLSKLALVLLAAFCLLPSAFCQSPTVTVSFSPQPLASFVAAFGSKVDGVAVYSVDACTNAQGIEIPAGRIRQAAAPKFATINRELLFVTLASAKRRNWRSITVEALKWGSLFGTVITTSGLVAASDAIIGGLAVGHAAIDRFDDELSRQLPDAATAFGSAFLSDNEWITIPPGGCAPSRLLLGRYVKGLGAFTEELK